MPKKILSGNKSQDAVDEIGKIVTQEPEKIFEARKQMKRKNAETIMTVGVALLIGLIWLVTVFMSSVLCGIIGMIVLGLSIFFISFGFYRRSCVDKIKPITVYKHGLNMPQYDGQIIFFPFDEFSDYPMEIIDGNEIITLKKGYYEYDLVIWPELLEIIHKEPKKAFSSRRKKKKKK
ncbi:hypothetical protein [[Eubacterium] cellulosolvens]